jgi:hypothetical protein
MGRIRRARQRNGPIAVSEAAAKGGDNDRERRDCYYALSPIEVECPPIEF